MKATRKLLIAALAILAAACGRNEDTTDSGERGSDANVTENVGDTDPTANVEKDAAETLGYSAAPSGEYVLDKGHAYIVFSYDHQGYSTPFLRWGDWDATLNWDNGNPELSSLSAEIQTASVDSGVDVFDGHLKGEDFFDVENHPTVSFVATSVEKTGEDTGVITGDLAMKGQTHPVTLDVTFNQAAFDQRANAHKIGFSAKTTIQRSQWGLDRFVPGVSDDVEIMIEAEFEQPAAD